MLQTLGVLYTGSALIPDAGMVGFVDNCPLLCDVNVEYCNNVSKATIAAAAARTEGVGGGIRNSVMHAVIRGVVSAH